MTPAGRVHHQTSRLRQTAYDALLRLTDVVSMWVIARRDGSPGSKTMLEQLKRKVDDEETIVLDAFQRLRDVIAEAEEGL